MSVLMAQPPAIEDKPAAQEEPKPSIKTIHLTAIEPGQVLEVDGSPSFLALVDSGATHALRAASSEAEWASAQPVVVSLAGSETSAMRLSGEFRRQGLEGSEVPTLGLPQSSTSFRVRSSTPLRFQACITRFG